MAKLTTLVVVAAVALLAAAEIPGTAASAATIFGLNCKGSIRCSKITGGKCSSTGLGTGDGPFNIAALWNPGGSTGIETIDEDGVVVGPIPFTISSFVANANGTFTTTWTSTFGTQKFFGVFTSYSSGIAKKFRGVTTDTYDSAACDGDAQ